MSRESTSRSAPNASPRGFQFSLLALFLLMTAAAVVLGGIVALAAALGIATTDAVLQAVSQQVTHLPMLIVWLVAIVMLINRSQRYPRAARYGLLGFGSLLLLSLINMGFQICIIAMLNNSTVSGANFGWIYGIYSFVYSSLAAVCYGLLLAAILAGRADGAWPTGPLRSSGEADGGVDDLAS